MYFVIQKSILPYLVIPIGCCTYPYLLLETFIQQIPETDIVMANKNVCLIRSAEYTFVKIPALNANSVASD